MHEGHGTIVAELSLGWAMGVKEGAAWAGLEDDNRSWAPRAEDGAIWGVAVSPAGPAVDSVSHGAARAAGSGHRVGITDAGGSGSGASAGSLPCAVD